MDISKAVAVNIMTEQEEKNLLKNIALVFLYEFLMIFIFLWLKNSNSTDITSLLMRLFSSVGQSYIAKPVADVCPCLAVARIGR